MDDDPSLRRVLILLARTRREIAALEAEQAEMPKRLKKLSRSLEMWTEVHKILSEHYDEDVDYISLPPPAPA